jgi:CubicO group peptidase (beta-lactamase class C family)
MKSMFFLAVALVGGCGSGGKPAPHEPRGTGGALALQTRVEGAILPAVQVKGEDVATTLAQLMADHRVPGLSIAVWDDYHLVWAKAYGVVEAGGTAPVTEATLFQAGSISKSVNALAVLGAVADGKLAYDAPINDALKSWKLPDNELTRAAPVTLERLLSHTAGTTVHGFPGYAVGAPVPTVIQVLDGQPPANTAAVRVDLTPGTQFRYSGGGTTITQLALVDALGAPYPQLLRERVLEPLDMTDSTYEQPLPPARLAYAAAGHHRDGAVVPGKRHTYPEMAAAGLWTTPTDLAKFFLELQLALAGKSDRVSREVAVQLTTPSAVAADVAHGVFLSARNGVRMFGHGGADEGFQASSIASLDGGYGVVVMAASDRGHEIFRDIERTVFAAMGWPAADPLIERVPLDPAIAATIAGRYLTGDGVPFEVTTTGGKVMFATPFLAGHELVPVAGGGLVDRENGGRLRLLSSGDLEGTPPGGPAAATVTAKRLDPATTLPLFALAAGRFDDAVAMWKAAVAADPKAPGFSEDGHNLFGYTLLQEGKVAEALLVFRAIALVFPDSSNAHDSLADGYKAAGDTAHAIEGYEAALRLLDADPRIPAEAKAARRTYEEAQLKALRGK